MLWFRHIDRKWEAFLSRKISIRIFLLCGMAAILGIVTFGWLEKHYAEGYRQFGKVGKVVDIISSFPSLVAESFRTVTTNPLEISTDGFDGQIGLKREDQGFVDAGFLLLAAYDEAVRASSVKLVRLSDGAVLHRWLPDVNEINKRINYVPGIDIRYDQRNFRPNHPLLTSDGGIVFNNNGPLVKLNACSRVEWVLNGLFHHSVARNSDGSVILVPAVRTPSVFRPEKYPFLIDDSYAEVSADGELLRMASITKILLDNGYRGLLFGAGMYEHDNIHLNYVEAAYSTTDFWKKGDLLVSLRYISTVFLYRPDERRVVWLKTGPWLNQHAAKFVGDSRISVFGNDIVRPASPPRDRFFVDGHSTVYIHDFKTGRTLKPYDSVMAGLGIRAESEGLSEILPNGDAFVEDSTAGRIVRISPDRVRWSYVNRQRAAGAVSLLNWSRYVGAAEATAVLPKLRCGE